MNILQNVKSGFGSIKELFGILLSDEDVNDYDLYINGNDPSLAETAQTLKQIEEEQEMKRLSNFDIKSKVTRKRSSHSK